MKNETPEQFAEAMNFANQSIPLSTTSEPNTCGGHYAALTGSPYAPRFKEQAYVAEINQLLARVAELEQSRDSWHKLADEFEIQQDHYRLTLEHLRAAIRDHGTCAGTLMVNPGQGHGIVTADDFIANSLEIFN